MATKLIKKGATLAAIVAALSLSSCKKEDSNANVNSHSNILTTSITGKKNLPPLTVEVQGGIEENPTGQASETFTFNRFPDSVKEFSEVREKVGTRLGGAILLQIMAMEMYSHNKAIGEECVKLCVTTTYQRFVVDSFKRVFYEYKKPYAAASLLVGSKPATGYNPTEPYTITVEVDTALMKDTEKEAGGTYSSEFQAYLKYLKVYNFRRLKGNGYIAKEFAQFSVVKTAKPNEPSQDKYYLVQSSGDILVDPEPVSYSHPYKGVAPFIN